MEFIAHLRSDLYNSQGTKKLDGSHFTAQDFGAEAPPVNRQPPSMQELKARLISRFGPDGDRKRGSAAKRSALADLKGHVVEIPSKAG